MAAGPERQRCLAGPGQARESTRIPSLDGLRACSIGFVILGHLVGTLHFPRLLWLLPFAEFGVRFFFVISGFLITTLLLKELEFSSHISLKKFYWRRVLRIFPASYSYIAIIALFAAANVIRLHAHDLLHATTYTMDYRLAGTSWYLGHLWSLSVEEQFYLLWPLTLALAGRKRGIFIALLVCLVAPFIRLGDFVYFPSIRSQIGVRFETVADSLAMGCLLAGVRDALTYNRGYQRFLSSRLFVLVPLLTLGANDFLLNWKFRYTLEDTLMNVGIALCMDWSIRFKEHAAGRFLNWRPVAFVGVLSYSLYLWQQPFLNRTVYSHAVIFPVNVVLAFGAALASYYFIEQPFLKLKKRFESRLVKIAVAKQATAQAHGNQS